MRSRASYRGHPIHPALIHFPIAFIIAAFAFDAAGWLSGSSGLWATGGYLAAAGVLTALVAAVPGLIDYIYTVPPESSAKQRATMHLIINLSAVLLVAIAWLLRQNTVLPAIVVATEAASVALLVPGAWMGATLVSRNQIGIDRRYAGAGKSKEVDLSAPPGVMVRVATIHELGVNQMKLVRAGKRRIVLARAENGHFAFDDSCSHRGGSLADGSMMCGTVQCPWHGSQFDVSSGIVKAGPAHKNLSTYRVTVRGADVYLMLEPRTAIEPGVATDAGEFRSRTQRR
jgi:nitrite reductase/ring-hydroxylating ferredoxin subunit/uncharacterized membrane protein